MKFLKATLNNKGLVFRCLPMAVLLLSASLALAEESGGDRDPASTTVAKAIDETTEGESAVNFEIRYKGDVIRNFSGGTEVKTEYVGNLDLYSETDFEKLFGSKGTSFVLYGLGNHGGRPKAYIGDSFGSTNIEAPGTFKIYEAYIKQNFDDRFHLILGLRDLNADYYAVDTAGGLINSAFGISPSLSQTGVNGPSIFPTTSLALAFKYVSPEAFYFQAGVFNAQAGDPAKPYGTQINTKNSEGYLYIWETGFAGGEEHNAYKYALGMWAYSKYKAAIDTTKSNEQNTGSYLLINKNFTENFAVFLKYGMASETLNQFSRAVEAGFSVKSLFSARPNDVLTLGHARVNVSDDYQRVNGSTQEEYVTELSYRFELNEHVAVIPDFQYVKYPGVSSTNKDVQVGILRFEFKY